MISLRKPAFMLFAAGMMIFAGCKAPVSDSGSTATDDEFYVAAYVWPSRHNDPRGQEKLWSEGTGEWEMIRKGDPRFEGHYQPRLPLWGYEADNDPVAVERKIEAATANGVNVFIYDWYWYDGQPFLESALNDGFLKARNNEKMKFYIMWANHDVPGNMWNHYRYKTDSLIWTGMIDRTNYEIIVERIINQYFTQPNYLKIDGMPVFSIFSLPIFIKSFDGLEGAAEALDYMRDEVEKAGFPGLHIQVTGWTRDGHPFLSGEQDHAGINGIVEKLGINSITIYNWIATGLNEDYLQWAENALRVRDEWDSVLEIPYFPHVSIGWDDTPRYPWKGKKEVVHIHNTPESFAMYLQKSKDWLDKRPEQPKLITINSWNEWVEGSYLEPDMLWGYGYLEAVKRVISGD